MSFTIAAIPFGLQSTLLFGISPRDPVTFGAMGLFLAMLAMAAAYRPARRAAKVDPMIVLRHD